LSPRPGAVSGPLPPDRRFSARLALVGACSAARGACSGPPGAMSSCAAARSADALVRLTGFGQRLPHNCSLHVSARNRSCQRLVTMHIIGHWPWVQHLDAGRITTRRRAGREVLPTPSPAALALSRSLSRWFWFGVCEACGTCRRCGARHGVRWWERWGVGAGGWWARFQGKAHPVCACGDRWRWLSALSDVVAANRLFAWGRACRQPPEARGEKPRYCASWSDVVGTRGDAFPFRVFAGVRRWSWCRPWRRLGAGELCGPDRMWGELPREVGRRQARGRMRVSLPGRLREARWAWSWLCSHWRRLSQARRGLQR
jgi:hypothetical protein